MSTQPGKKTEEKRAEQLVKTVATRRLYRIAAEFYRLQRVRDTEPAGRPPPASSTHRRAKVGPAQPQAEPQPDGRGGNTTMVA
eukprot:CAMPEP_0117656464 /NCGR_PEP_ID=MMETSP0804-20121206/4818_1 /TAXON_ID=1074897 /ORGANISM="Tetraselmis astigmatica, Strain CCMP880" /LENGTH=82 /DNA_ID=CAMNT_0005462867 /DNA_START=35 /DNA_END=283 /DNA_ORIENTATION=+